MQFSNKQFVNKCYWRNKFKEWMANMSLKSRFYHIKRSVLNSAAFLKAHEVKLWRNFFLKPVINVLHFKWDTLELRCQIQNVSMKYSLQLLLSLWRDSIRFTKYYNTMALPVNHSDLILLNSMEKEISEILNIYRFHLSRRSNCRMKA